MMEPKYSIIVPTYNRASLLGRALDSIRRQEDIDLQALEILILDDASKDNTAEVIEKYQKQYPKLRIYYEKLSHLGRPGLVRNHGLKIARGQWIAYLDSDDRWLPYHLLTVEAYVRRYPHIAHFMTWWSRSTLIFKEGQWTETYDALPKYASDAVATNSHVHKRDCFTQLGGFSASRWGEDRDFWKKINRFFPHLYIPIATTVNSYIVGGNNITYGFRKDLKREFRGGNAESLL